MSSRRRPWPTTTCSPAAGLPRVVARISQVPSGTRPEEEALPAAAGRLAVADQPGGEHPRVVPDQDVARVEQFGERRRSDDAPSARSGGRPPSAATGRGARPGAGRSARRAGGNRTPRSASPFLRVRLHGHNGMRSSPQLASDEPRRADRTANAIVPDPCKTSRSRLPRACAGPGPTDRSRSPW